MRIWALIEILADFACRITATHVENVPVNLVYTRCKSIRLCALGSIKSQLRYHISMIVVYVLGYQHGLAFRELYEVLDGFVAFVWLASVH